MQAFKDSTVPTGLSGCPATPVTPLTSCVKMMYIQWLTPGKGRILWWKIYRSTDTLIGYLRAKIDTYGRTSVMTHIDPLRQAIHSGFLHLAKEKPITDMQNWLWVDPHPSLYVHPLLHHRPLFNQEGRPPLTAPTQHLRHSIMLLTQHISLMGILNS